MSDKDKRIAENLAKHNLKVGDRIVLNGEGFQKQIGVVVGYEKGRETFLLIVPQFTSVPRLKNEQDVASSYEDIWKQGEKFWAYYPSSTFNKIDNANDQSIIDALAKLNLRVGDKVKAAYSEKIGTVVGYSNIELQPITYFDNSEKLGAKYSAKSKSDFTSEYAYLSENSTEHCACIHTTNLTKIQSQSPNKDQRIIERLSKLGFTIGDKVKPLIDPFSKYTATIVGIHPTSEDPILYFAEDLSAHTPSPKTTDYFSSANEHLSTDVQKHCIRFYPHQIRKVKLDDLKTIVRNDNDNKIIERLAKHNLSLGDVVKSTAVPDRIATVVGFHVGNILLHYQEDIASFIHISKPENTIASQYTNLCEMQRHHIFAEGFISHISKLASVSDIEKMAEVDDEIKAYHLDKKTFSITETMLNRAKQTLANDASIVKQLTKSGFSLGEKVNLDHPGEDIVGTIIGCNSEDVLLVKVDKDISIYIDTNKSKTSFHSQYKNSWETQKNHVYAAHISSITKMTPEHINKVMNENDQKIDQQLKKLGFQVGQKVVYTITTTATDYVGAIDYVGTIVGIRADHTPLVFFDTLAPPNMDDLASKKWANQDCISSNYLADIQKNAKNLKDISPTVITDYNKWRITQELKNLGFTPGERVLTNYNKKVCSGTVVGTHTKGNFSVVILDEPATTGGLIPELRTKENILSPYLEHIQKNPELFVFGAHPSELSSEAAQNKKIENRLAACGFKLGEQVYTSEKYKGTIIGAYGDPFPTPIVAFSDTTRLPIDNATNYLDSGIADAKNVHSTYAHLRHLPMNVYPWSPRALKKENKVDQEIKNSLSKTNFKIGQRVVCTKSKDLLDVIVWNSNGVSSVVYGTIVGETNGKPIVFFDKEGDGLWDASQVLIDNCKFHSSYIDSVKASPNRRCAFVEPAAIKDANDYDKALTLKQAEEATAKLQAQKAQEAQETEIKAFLATQKLKPGDKVELSCSFGSPAWREWKKDSTERRLATVVGTYCTGNSAPQKVLVSLEGAGGWNKEHSGFKHTKLAQQYKDTAARFLYIEPGAVRKVPLFGLRLGDKVEDTIFGIKGTVIGVSYEGVPLIVWDGEHYKNNSSVYQTDFILEGFKDIKHLDVINADKAKTIRKLEQEKVPTAPPIPNEEELISAQLAKYGLTVGDKIELSYDKNGAVKWYEGENNNWKSAHIGTVVGICKDNIVVAFDNKIGWSRKEAPLPTKFSKKFPDRTENFLWVHPQAFRKVPLYGFKIGDRVRDSLSNTDGIVIGQTTKATPTSFPVGTPLVVWDNSLANYSPISPSDYIPEEYKHHTAVGLTSKWESINHISIIEKTSEKIIPAKEISGAMIPPSSLSLPPDRSSFKYHLHEAGYRVAATQLTNVSKATLVKLLRSRGMGSTHIQNFTQFLDSELGKSFLALLIGTGLSQIKQEDKRVQKLATEFRIGGMTNAGNLAIDALVEHLKPALLEVLKSAIEDHSTSEKQVRIDTSPQNTGLIEALQEEEFEEEYKTSFKD